MGGKKQLSCPTVSSPLRKRPQLLPLISHHPMPCHGRCGKQTDTLSVAVGRCDISIHVSLALSLPQERHGASEGHAGLLRTQPPAAADGAAELRAGDAPCGAAGPVHGPQRIAAGVGAAGRGCCGVWVTAGVPEERGTGYRGWAARFAEQGCSSGGVKRGVAVKRGATLKRGMTGKVGFKISKANRSGNEAHGALEWRGW